MSAANKDPLEGYAPPRTMFNLISAFAEGVEGGPGLTMLKVASLITAFVLLAAWFNNQRNHGFANQEAMESAQVARHLAAGDGYTTYSIRPLTLGLLQRADSTQAEKVLQHPVPDLTIPPVYPLLTAALMKVLPFNYVANSERPWPYQPETLIVLFNEVLFFAAAILTFLLARHLFDSGVAWIAAVAFIAAETYWRFCLSGLSTLFLIVLFLGLTWCLVALENRERQTPPRAAGPSLALAIAIGALIAIGGLTRYSFLFFIIPTLLFIALFCPPHRWRLCLAAAVTFFVLVFPWTLRNIGLSGAPFGTAGYAYLEDARPTRPIDQDRMQRSFDPAFGGGRLAAAHAVINKFLSNEAKILRFEFPRLGGSWISFFFLCGLLLPFRNPPLRRLRAFLVCSLVLLAIVQAVGQTYLTVEFPDINSENLLVLTGPLVAIFGVGFFYTLLDQLAIPNPKLRGGAVALFALVVSAPILLDLVSPSEFNGISPYVPFQIQRTAAMMNPDELMMSDLPWAVAWYGNRPCCWLTVDDAASFVELNKLKPIHALYFTERSTDRSWLQQSLDATRGWGRFLVNAIPPLRTQHGIVPDGFPLTKSAPGYIPIQLFLSDKERWRTSTNDPPLRP